MSANKLKLTYLLEENKLSDDQKKAIYIPSGSENSEKSSDKNPLNPLAMRNPLGDICENIQLGKRISSKRQIRKSKVLVETKVVKPSESNDKQTIIKYTRKYENVTERENPEEAVKISDEVFVEGEEHYLNYLPPSQILDVCSGTRAKSEDVKTKISKPLPTIRISCPGEESVAVKKPSQKVTLTRKLSNRHKHLIKDDDLYNNALYSDEYYLDNYKYMLKTERHFVFRKDMMRRSINEDYRRVIVNWLIYVQQIFGFAEPTFFTGVRIYDYVLVNSELSVKQYLLVGVTCLWIANKHLDVKFIQVPKLCSLCNGKYSKQQFLSMEKEILKLIKFNVMFPEPTTFLFYYLDRENLQKNLKIRHSAMFLLEVYTLLLDFSSLSPSLLACLALYLALDKYNLDSVPFLDFIDQHLLDKESFIKKSKQFEYYVDQLLRVEAVTKEVVKKYSRANKCAIALEFLPK